MEIKYKDISRMDWNAYQEGFESFGKYVSEYKKTNSSKECLNYTKCPYSDSMEYISKESSWIIGYNDAVIISLEISRKEFIDKFYDGIEPE